jgi:hypothetical protein
MAKQLTKRQATWQGGHWITPKRRLALYLRDGLACVWCCRGIEDGAQLSLDHVVCHADGGGTESGNLITCCKTCNSSRGKRSVPAFAEAVAAYLNHGVIAQQVIDRVQAAVCRPVPLTEAAELLARRGTLTAAVRGKES